MKLPGRFFERDENLVVLVGLIGGVALALTLLAVYAWVVPESESQTETLASYEHTGRYTYSVATAPSALNPNETIGPVLPEQVEDSGEPPPPIFTRLARGLEFIYVYQAQGASNVSGTVSAELEIKAGTSWTQRLPLAGPIEFSGATGGVEGMVDFTQVAALLQQVEEQTGVTSGSVDLTIIPTVDVQGTANGQQFDETYSSPLTFTYTSNLITPGESLSFNELRTITATTQIENEINLFGGSVLVSTVRDIATPLAVATLALSGVFAAVFFLGVGRSEVATIRSRFRDLIVPVADVESLVSHRISVGSLLDLAQLAKRENRSLFVRDFDNGSQAYLMHDGMVIYEYTIGDVPLGWIHSPGAPVAVAVSPSVTVAETVAAPELQEPAAPLVVENQASAVEEPETALASYEEIAETVTEPELAAVEEEILAVAEEEPVEEPVAEAAAIEEEILAIAEAETVEAFVTAPADEEIVAFAEEEMTEEPVPFVAADEEVVLISEAVEVPSHQATEVDEIIRVIAEVTAEEESGVPAEAEAAAVIAEEAEPPAIATASYEEFFGVTEETIEELTAPSKEDEETAETVEEPEEQATALEEEAQAIAEAETETVEASIVTQAVIDEDVEPFAIAPTSYEELLGVAEETTEELTRLLMADQEAVPAVEAGVQAEAVEDKIRAVAGVETVEECIAPAATEDEPVVAEEPIEGPTAPAAIEEEEVSITEASAPVAGAEAVSIETETTDASYEPIPEWLTAAYEYEEPDEAESAEGSEAAVEEEAASSESNGLDHAPEEPAEAVAVNPWATWRVEMDSTSASDAPPDSQETEEAPIAMEQPQGDPAYLAWRRPQGSAPESTETAAESAADVEPAQEEIEAVAASDETAAPAPSPVHSHVRTPGYTRAHSPRTAVRRWLRNRSGGPLLDDVHVRESSVRTGVASEPDESAHVADFQDSESDGTGVYEEPSADIIEQEMIQMSVAQVNEPEAAAKPEPQFEAEVSEPAEASVEQDVDSSIVYDEPVADLDLEASFEDAASALAQANDAAPTESPAPAAEAFVPQEAPARPSQQPAALDRKLVRYARRWLRDFLAESDEGPNQR
jgi:hypothetical protein